MVFVLRGISHHVAGTSELEITNERLRCQLTQADLQRVTAFASQLAAVLAALYPAQSVMCPPDIIPPGVNGWDPGDLSSSLHSTVGSAGSASGGVRVMDGVQEDAFRGWVPPACLI